MYLQEIVISPDIFEKISRAFSENFDEDIDLKSYKENLNLKKILFDDVANGESIIFKEIKNIISNSTGFGRQKIDSVLKIFLKEGRCEYREIRNSKKYCKDDVLNKLINLCVLSESNIVNSENKSLNLLKIKNQDLEEIEVLNFEELIKPEFNSRNYCNSKQLKIERGNKFNFEEYFKPYLCETKKIVVTDKYLRKRDGGHMNLIRLLNLCSKLEHIKINTFLRDASEKYKPDITISEMENEIKGIKNNIEINFKTSGSHMRSLETDDFLITLDPGFDFVNKEYLTERHDAVIEFKRKQEIV